MADNTANGMRTVGAIVGLLAIIGGVGSIILPIQGSIDDVNDRLDREVEVIERQLETLDKQLQTEIGTLAVRIDAEDDLSSERDTNQGQSFKDQLDALDGKLQAEGALIRSEAQTEIAALRERINAIRDIIGLLGGPVPPLVESGP